MRNRKIVKWLAAVLCLIMMAGLGMEASAGMAPQDPTPSAEPTVAPAEEPSPFVEPTAAPTEVPAPSAEPTAAPTEVPTPSAEPTAAPTEVPAPSVEPTTVPTEEPTPTVSPSVEPSATPEVTPTADQNLTDSTQTASPSAGAENEKDSSEETTAEESDMSTSAAKPVAATGEPQTLDDGKVGYWEKQAPFVPNTEEYVVKLDFKSTGLNWSQFSTFFTDNKDRFSFKLAKPSGEDIALPEYKITNARQALYWSFASNPFSEPGQYTLEMTDNGESGTYNKSFPLDIIQVNFHATTKGQFEGGSSEYTGYGTQDILLSYYNVPEVTPVGEEASSFLGWAKEEGKTDYADLITKTSEGTASENTYDVYAAYGVKKITRISLYDKDPSNPDAQPLPDTGHTLDIGDYNYGETPSGSSSIWVKNTGNQPCPLSLPVSTDKFEVKIEEQEQVKDGNLLENGIVKITVSPKAGLEVGSYDETMYIRSNDIKIVTVHFDVLSSEISLSLEEDISKPYGDTLTNEEVLKHITAPESVNLNDLGLKFSSAGFSEDAAVGSYDITLADWDKNYNVKLTETGHLQVTAVEPAGSETVTASAVKAGDSLEKSALNGSFHHPKQDGWIVEGTLTWSEGQSAGSLTEGTHPFTWVFTPSSKNYSSVEGTTDVHVSAKIPTDIHATSGSSFTYNKLPHGMTFSSDRPAGNKGNITVQYKLKDAGEDTWTEDVPYKAGEYSVKASIEGTDIYAEASEIFDFTINKREIDVTASAKNKVYDGTTKAELDKVHLSSVVSGDDVQLDTASCEAWFNSKDVGDRKFVTFKPVALIGRDAENYRLKEGIHHASLTAAITPATITSIQPTERLTKGYGDTFNLTADQFTFTGLAAGEDASVLDVEWSCGGTTALANVGEYPITAAFHAGNYELASSAANAGTLSVVQAVPKLLEDTLNTGYGSTGRTLETVPLNAIFVNPHDTTKVVEGTFTWKEPQTVIVDQDGKFTATWLFTPANTQNYTSPGEMTVDIPLVDNPPIQFTVADKAVTYDGKAQSLEGDVKVTEAGIDPSSVTVEIMYRHHQDLVRKISNNLLSWDTWNADPPTDAGIYDVQVTVSPDDANFAENTITVTLTINKADPDIKDVEKEIAVKKGTLLSDADLKSRPKGVDDKDLEGTFTWEYAEKPVEKGGERYQWVFTPKDTKNYHVVTGSTIVNLAEEADTRTIKAAVYNLPDELGYDDYAVVDVAASGLKSGDTVVFYKSASEDEATMVSEIVKVTEGAPSLIVQLDSGALAPAAGTIFARIASSETHRANEIPYPAEIGFTVPNTLEVKAGGSETLAAAIQAGTPERVNFTLTGEHDGQVVDLQQKGANSLEVTITGKAAGHAAVLVEIEFTHPDSSNYPNQVITVTRSVQITVLDGTEPTPTPDPGSATEPTAAPEPTPTTEPTAAPEPTPTTDVEVEAGLGKMEITKELKEAGLDSTEKVVEKLEEAVFSSGYTGRKENIKLYDVELLIKVDGGDWEPAAPENFPAGGLTITIPYPEGTNRTFSFVVKHMFTHNMNGYEAGYVETCKPGKTDDGIQVTVHGLSPIAVAWSAPAATPTAAVPTAAVPTAAVPTAAVPTAVPASTPGSSPLTGDETNICLLVSLLVLSMAGLVSIWFYWKKHRRSDR